MKKVFIFLITAVAVTLILYSAHPSEINSPAPVEEEEQFIEGAEVFSDAIEAEKKLFPDEAARYLETVAFEYIEPEIDPAAVDINDDSFAIVGIGDSLTLGTGGKDANGYLNSVKRYYEKTNDDVVVVNHGEYGAQAHHLLNKLNDSNMESDIRRADVLFMTLGGNDLVSVFNHNFTHLTIGDFTKGEESFKADLRKIMSTVRLLNEDAPVYFIGIFNPVYESLGEIKEFNEIITSWNGSTKDLLEMYPNTTFVPVQHLFEKDASLYLSEDLFHPNDEGYERIGDEIISRTEEILMVQRNPL
ncbi:GDSL-type esterase/lipase family protein [Bacillus salacetis]|nr:GDSL-type esterase/lipase family protein [Bacillus salacetis]